MFVPLAELPASTTAREKPYLFKSSFLQISPDDGAPE
jgi:hypothetical protein